MVGHFGVDPAVGMDSEISVTTAEATVVVQPPCDAHAERVAHRWDGCTRVQLTTRAAYCSLGKKKEEKE